MVKMTKYSIVVFLLILNVTFIFIILSFADDGYRPGRFIPKQKFKGEKPDPYKDFLNLNKLFHENNGMLYSSDEKKVKWIDTEMFRMFEFKNHTVVIFPYDWKKKNFDLLLFQGHVKNYENLYESIKLKHRTNDKDKVFYQNENMYFNNFGIGKIGFDNLTFGETKSDVRKKIVPIINKKWNDREQREIRLELLTFAKTHMNGSTMKFQFFLYFEKDRLSYMNFRTENVTKLGSYSIGHPKLTIVGRGEFDLR
jgi:hypothetical protein